MKELQGVATGSRFGGNPVVGIRSAEIQVNPPAIRTLAATQVQLVPAPGPGFVNLPVGALASLIFPTGGTAHDDAAADGDLQILYTNGAGARAFSILEADTFIDAVASTMRYFTANDDFIPVENAAFVLDNDGAEFTGTGTSFLKIKVFFWTARAF